MKKTNQKLFLLHWAWSHVTASLLSGWKCVEMQVNSPPHWGENTFHCLGCVLKHCFWVRVSDSLHLPILLLELWRPDQGDTPPVFLGGELLPLGRLTNMPCRQKPAVGHVHILYLPTVYCCMCPLIWIISIGICVKPLWSEKQLILTCVPDSSTLDLPRQAGALLHTPQVDPTPRLTVVIVAQV